MEVGKESGFEVGGGGRKKPPPFFGAAAEASWMI
jgi:hypothetical protein